MRKVIVTGIGLVTSLGLDRETTWKAVCDGRSGVRRVEGLPISVAAPVAWRSENGLPRAAAFAVRAAQEAWQDARLDADPPDPYRVGCTVSASKPHIAAVDRVTSVLARAESEHPWWEAFCPDGVPRAVASRLGLAGPQRNVVAACATGLYAVATGASWIQHGECDICVAGSAEASLHPLVVAGFAQMGVLAQGTNGTAPHDLARPFDRQRTGFVLGEGAGVVILEAQERARLRGIRSYGELLGWGMGCDPSHPVRSARDGRPIARVIQQALQIAGISPAMLDYINAHGTGTRLNDVSETRAIKEALGQQVYGIPVSGTKAATGHLLGAAGSVELAFTLLAKRDGFIPPTLNLEDPDPACDLDYTPRLGRSHLVRMAMSLSFGFGGPVGVALIG